MLLDHVIQTYITSYRLVEVSAHANRLVEEADSALAVGENRFVEARIACSLFKQIKETNKTNETKRNETVFLSFGLLYTNHNHLH